MRRQRFGTEISLILGLVGMASILVIFAFPISDKGEQVLPRAKVLPNDPFVQHERVMAQPAPNYIEPTLEERAVAAARQEKEKAEMARLMKISKPVQIQLVSGKMPLVASVISPATYETREAVFDCGAEYFVVKAEVFSSCSAPQGISAPPFGWSLQYSTDGYRWKNGYLTYQLWGFVFRLIQF